MVSFERAMVVVLELARENILSVHDADENDLHSARVEQMESCDLVEDFIVNQLGEE